MPHAIGDLDNIPRRILTHTPTPIEAMPNLSKQFSATQLYVKRDDCTGLCMGGNKSRQLEFYMGEAIRQAADTIVITGAVQSNFTRMAAAAARKNGMDCHIQLENRVPNKTNSYNQSGNVFISRILGATLHSSPISGDDEAGADQNLECIADDLQHQGKHPYIIHLSDNYPPLGSLGYVVAAREIVEQLSQDKLTFDAIVVPSGSGSTHAGLLFGLRALGCTIPVKGICVRRPAEVQHERIIGLCRKISDLLNMGNPVSVADVEVIDTVLAPGYGLINDSVLEAIKLTARYEGIILDPVYSGRAMAGLFLLARQNKQQQDTLFIHTGGQPAIYGYDTDLEAIFTHS